VATGRAVLDGRGKRKTGAHTAVPSPAAATHLHTSTICSVVCLLCLLYALPTVRALLIWPAYRY
jgi:hypothetical protein